MTVTILVSLGKDNKVEYKIEDVLNIYQLKQILCEKLGKEVTVELLDNLKEEYRLANGIVYDYVIRARFDINYNIKIDCSQFNDNIVYICNRQLPDHDMVDDRFAFGSNHNMNIYSSGFGWMDYMCKLRDTKDGIFCGETLVYEMLTMSNIVNNKISNLVCSRLHS